MQCPVQVISSRAYSFPGSDGRPVNIVEAVCLVKSPQGDAVGKVNIRGTAALVPGNYSATVKPSARDGVLSFKLADFVPAAQAYAAASGASK